MNHQYPSYAPPTGPPPGWQPDHQHPHGHSQQSQRHQNPPDYWPSPTQHKADSLHHYLQHCYGHNHYASSPGLGPNQNKAFHAPQQGHHHPSNPLTQHTSPHVNLQGSLPHAGSAVQFPQKFFIWYRYSGKDSETYLDIGKTTKQEPILFSAKLHVSGKLTLKRDKFRSNNPSLGTAKDQGIMGSSSELVLENGPTATWKSEGSMGDKRFVLDFSHNGRNESWVWEMNKQSLGERLSGKNKGCKLYRRNGNGPPAAVFTYDSDDHGTSKSTMGCFEFGQAAMMGQMGPHFQVLAVMAFLRLTQKNYKKKMVKMITRLVTGV